MPGGIIPGGGGTQRLPRLVGRSRALEVILGCRDFSAELAERYGYLNRALPAEELTPFVEDLAYRIASFPAESTTCSGTLPPGSSSKLQITASPSLPTCTSLTAVGDFSIGARALLYFM